MKQITFILIFLFAVLNLPAQSSLPIINDFNDFHGTNLSEAYPGWYEADGVNTPAQGSSAWFSSDELFDKAAGIGFQNGTSHRDWIISPEFIATAHSKVTFKAALTILYDDPGQGFFGHDDSVTVMVNPEGLGYEPVFTFDMNSTLTNELQFFQVDLSQYEGQQIRIGFYATDGNQPTGFAAFHMDDIVIKNAAATDAQITHIISPDMHTCLSEETPIQIMVRNDGYNALAGIPIRTKLRGKKNQNVYSFITDTLQPGAKQMFQVGTADLSDLGNYSISAVTEVASDTIARNNNSDTLYFEKRNPADLPLPTMTFTDFYESNLNEIYPEWREARGAKVPQIYKNTDWQGDEHPESRGASVYFVSVGTNDWLVGPIIQPTENTYITLDAAIYFDEFSTQMGSDDKLAAMISTDCGTTWDEVGTITQSDALDTLYEPFAFSLSDYAGAHVKVAIYATTNETMDDESYIFFIDNLAVTDKWQNDIGITDVISPVASCGFTDTEILTVKVQNEGFQQIDQFTASYTLNDGTPVEETVDTTIEPGEYLEYTFSQTLDLTVQSENNIQINVSFSQDENPENDTITYSPVINAFDLSTDGAFTSGFESDEDLSGWIVVNNNDDEEEWEIATDAQYAYEGSNSYSYFSNNTTTQSDDWLFAPCFQLEAGVNYVISFWYINRASAFPESLRLNLCNSASPDDVQQVINDFGAIDNSNFLQSENTISVSESGTYYFAWEAYGPADQFGLYIDNVSIRQEFNNDLTITDAYVPRTTNPVDCSLENTDSLVATIANLGTETINNFTIYTSINQGEATAQTFSQSITPGDTLQFTVNQGILFEPGISYNYQIWVEATTDNNPANDTLTCNEFMLNTYQTSFENNSDNNNWSSQSDAGVNEWMVYDDVEHARTGNNYFGIRTDGANSNNQNDDWLFSGCHYLEAGKCYEFRFWYRSLFSYENLTLKIGNSPDADSMETELYDDPDFYSNSYLEAEVLISVETTGAYYFGFHTDGGTAERYYVMIDDLEIKESDASPSVDITPHVLDREVLFETDAENVTDYYWEFGDGNTSDEQSPSHVYEANGIYNVSLDASSLCGMLEETLTVEQDFDTISADFSYTVDEALVSFVSSTSNADYISWDFGDGNHATGTEVSNTYHNAGNHSVTMLAYSPYEQKQITKTVTTTVSIQNLSYSNLMLYPNPASSVLHISSPGRLNSYTLYDISGKIIKQQKMADKQTTVDVSMLEPGTYIVGVQTEQSVYFVRFVVK